MSRQKDLLEEIATALSSRGAAEMLERTTGGVTFLYLAGLMVGASCVGSSDASA